MKSKNNYIKRINKIPIRGMIEDRNGEKLAINEMGFAILIRPHLSSYKNKENAIEEIVYDFLKDCETVEMSSESTKNLLMIAMLPKDLEFKEEEKPFLFKIMEKRIKHTLTFQITDERVLLVLSDWAKSAGQAILYLWYIQGWCFKHNVTEVDLETLATKMFPSGTFSEKDLESAWDNQKVNTEVLSSDNLVDYPIAGLSIQFLK